MKPLTEQHFLEQTLSPERWATYVDLSRKDTLKRPPEDLYALNLAYSKELYVVISGAEICLRNALHQKLMAYFKRESWFEKIKLGEKHAQDLNKAINYLSVKKKTMYVMGDLVSELGFGFWVHLLDRPYEQTLWNPVFSRSFPNKKGKPERKITEQELKKLVILRNKIAHLEPIIKQEETLIDRYNFSVNFISWVCPETSKWFENKSSFLSIYNENAASYLRKTL